MPCAQFDVLWVHEVTLVQLSRHQDNARVMERQGICGVAILYHIYVKSSKTYVKTPHREISKAIRAMRIRGTLGNGEVAFIVVRSLARLLWQRKECTALTLPTDDEPDNAFRTIQDIHAELDLESFDAMAVRPTLTGRQSENAPSESDDELDADDEMHVDNPFDMRREQAALEAVRVPPITPITPSRPPSEEPQQRTLQLNSGGAVGISQSIATSSAKKTGRRCGLCVSAYCRRRWECPGSGAQKYCSCLPRHPPLEGKRARMSEEVILAFLAAQEAEGRLTALGNTEWDDDDDDASDTKQREAGKSPTSG
ncbi:hypothetical protein BDZ89DRAFT_1117680 [Hymenopellis radicata]|nr:hypothetical protein BDZ89DRAFT_1117680 [Hymenopellis radicata]